MSIPEIDLYNILNLNKKIGKEEICRSARGAHPVVTIAKPLFRHSHD